MEEWVFLRGETLQSSFMQKDKEKPRTGVMPMSLELVSISLPLSALKKLCHSPQRESLQRAVLFPCD